MKTQKRCLLVGCCLAGWMLLASQPVFAQSATIDLSIQNPANEAGEIVVVAGTAIEVAFTINDPTAELSKKDTIVLIKISDGTVLDSVKRGSDTTGTVNLKTNKIGAYVQVRYLDSNDVVLSTAANGPVLVVTDEMMLLLLDRISSLEEELADTKDRVSANEQTVAQQAITIVDLQTELAATQYTDDDVVAVVSSMSIDWSQLFNVPADLADGDQDTLLSEAQVDEMVANNDYLSELPADLMALDDLVTVEGTEIYFTGANVHIQNGTGSSLSGTAVNGLGNLIVGYDEERFSNSQKTGSHNLVVGPYHNYTSQAGVVFGLHNTISGPHNSVTGGNNNIASGDFSSVTGGNSNLAYGDSSAVSGGSDNIASGPSSSVTGGYGSEASGLLSAITGGYGNEAKEQSSTITGGYGNEASGLYSSVSGGQNNTASGHFSSISGGRAHSVTGLFNWAAGTLFENQ